MFETAPLLNNNGNATTVIEKGKMDFSSFWSDYFTQCYQENDNLIEQKINMMGNTISTIEKAKAE